MQNVKYIGGSGKQKSAFSGSGSGSGGSGDVVASGNFVQKFIASAFDNAKTLIAKASVGLKMIGDVQNPDTPDDEGLYLMGGEHFTLVVTPNGPGLPVYEILGNAKCDHHAGVYRYRYNGSATMMRFGSYGSAVGFYYAVSGVAGNVISWIQYTVDLTSPMMHTFNPTLQDIDYQINCLSGSGAGSQGIFAIDAALRQVRFMKPSSVSPAMFWDFVAKTMYLDDQIKISVGGASAGAKMDIYKDASNAYQVLDFGANLGIGNFQSTPSAPVTISWEDNQNNAIINLLTLVHRALGSASVGIGGQIVISSERNNCSGTDMTTGIFGAFQSKSGDNSEVFLSNNQNAVVKKIIRGLENGFVRLSDTLAITPEGGIAVFVNNDIGFPSVKGYVVRSSPTSSNGVSLVPTDTNGAIFGVMYEDGVANGSSTWVVIDGMADVYTVNGSANGEVIRTALTGDASIVAGQARSVTTINTQAQCNARLGVYFGGNNGSAGLKRVKLCI